MTSTSTTHADACGNHGCGDELDCSQTVNSIMTRFPATVTVFNSFGVDLCCGASLSVSDAARANALDEHALCVALRTAARV